MILYPDYYCNKITDIPMEILENKNIKGIMLDIDNTIIDYDRKLINGIEEWIDKVKTKNIKCIIVSNTNKKDKVEKVAKQLDIPYIFFATKPLKRGFKKAQKLLDINFENIAEIGDQIFTDVVGAKKCKMFSILVNPISPNERFLTKIKRPLEGVVIKKYIRKQKNTGEDK